jgi:putative hydrolase of the HAD superfamily
MIKAIIFDMGGVVTSRGTLHPLAVRFARMMGLEEAEVHDVLDKYWRMWEVEKINEREFFENVARDLGASERKDKLREVMYNMVEPFEGILALAKKLRKNYKIFALTNHAREFFDFLEEKYGFEKQFDGIFKSYEARLAKPDSKFFRHMLKETGLKPEECVFIDDSEKNVKAAGMLGFKAILHKSLKQTEKEFKELGVNF